MNNRTSGTLVFFFAFVLVVSALFPPVILDDFIFFAAPAQVSKKEAAVLFVGDMMFDRSIRTTIEEKGEEYIFSCIRDLFGTVDLVVGNLEGPITSYASKSVGSVVGSPENYTFTFPTSTAALLKRNNVSLVSIGNNHIMNFGRDGLVQTKQWLESARVRHFGDPDAQESDRVARMTINDTPLSFINWSDWTSDKTDHTVAQVRVEKESGRVPIVYAHWGDEYVPPPQRVRELARSFVDAGAVIVIGSHPHVIQEMEEYHGARIYYSLGNFIFDQYWDDAVRTGLGVSVTFDTQGVVAVREHVFSLGRDRRTCLKSE